jgi:hypothetical protein
MLISRQQEIMKLNTENSMLKKAFGPQQVANDLSAQFASSTVSAFNANAPHTVSSDYPIINPIFDIPSNTESLNKSTPRFTITNPNLL